MNRLYVVAYSNKFIIIVGLQLYMHHMSWFLPLNTPYTATISTHLINLLEKGVLQKMYKNYVGSVAKTHTAVGSHNVNSKIEVSIIERI